MRKMFRTVLALGLLCVCGPAGAVTWSLQPVAGRVWNSTGFTNVTFSDAAVENNAHSSTTVTWINPVQIDTTAATTYSGSWTGVADGTGTGSSVCVRFCSFTDQSGAYSCPAQTCNTTSLWLTSSINSVTVPADGTLFVQTQLHCGTSASCSTTVAGLEVSH